MSKLAVPRPSSTVLLVRDAEGGVEVFLGQRPAESSFGSAYVFPGGVVEAADHGKSDCKGVSEDRANAVLSLDSGGLSYFVAAVRETFEEARVQLRCDELHYFSHWITPEVRPKRYSTRFFAARMPIGQTAVHCGEELLNSVWMTPAEALSGNRDGQIPMAHPTVRTLESVEHLKTVDELLTWADQKAAAGVKAVCLRRPA